MERVLKKIDKFICSYLGLEKAEFIPHSIRKKGKQLLVLNSESYKRHMHETPFSKINFDEINNENKQKLGIALGKSIAKNLIVSFDNIIIKKDKKS